VADGRDVELTRSEFDILVELLAAGRRVVSKSQLALVVRGESDPTAYVNDNDTRAIEVHVANLRRKLGDSPAAPRWVETVRGIGYRVTAR
jgi:DNA-binding response OmpR family regulator